MPAPKRRRWFSLSLRTVLIGMTLISVGFAWFLHQRQEMFREKERIAASFGERSVSSPSRYELEVYREGAFDAFQVGARFTFGDSILGWDLPEDTSHLSEAFGGGPDRWWWIRWAAGPRLQWAEVTRHADDDLLPPFAIAARRAKHIAIMRTSLATSYLQDCLSDQTESLYVGPDLVGGGWIETRGDVLTALNHSPHLKELNIPGLWSEQFSRASWTAVFSHPTLKELSFSGDVQVLGKLPAQAARSHLRLLTISITASEPEEMQVQYPFAWLGDCRELTTLDVNNDSPWFLLKASQKCPRVRELTIDHKPGFNDVAALKNWRELRQLVFNAIEDDEPIAVDDEVLAQVAESCPALESLTLSQRTEITPAGLLLLLRLPNLKRLELYCEMSAAHVDAVARLSSLEELLLTTEETVGDADIQPLKSLPRLKRICLDFTNVSEHEFARQRVSLSDF